MGIQLLPGIMLLLDRHIPSAFSLEAGDTNIDAQTLINRIMHDRIQFNKTLSFLE